MVSEPLRMIVLNPNWLLPSHHSFPLFYVWFVFSIGLHTQYVFLTLIMSWVLTDKPSSTINIKHAVMFVLDLWTTVDMWRELFEIHYIGYGVNHHLNPPIKAPWLDKEKDKGTAKSKYIMWISTHKFPTISNFSIISLLSMLITKEKLENYILIKKRSNYAHYAKWHFFFYHAIYMIFLPRFLCYM